MPFHLEALPTVFRVIHIELPEKTISGKIAVLIDQRKRSAYRMSKQIKLELVMTCT